MTDNHLSAEDSSSLENLLAEIGSGREAVLPLLQAVQEKYGYLPETALRWLAANSGLPETALWEVATFYPQFRHCPAGKYEIHVCHGTACHVKGAPRISDAIRRYLKIPDGADTDPEKIFTLREVACLGCCTLAPAMQIGDLTFGHLTPASIGTALEDFLRYEVERTNPQIEPEVSDTDAEIRISMVSCCIARGCGEVRDAAEEFLRQTGVRAKLKEVGCVGLCYQTPMLEIISADKSSHLYLRVRPEDVGELLLRHFTPPGLLRHATATLAVKLDHLLGKAPAEEKSDRENAPGQLLIALEDCGRFAPCDLREYQSGGGFEALRKALDMTHAEIIGEIGTSGLRGRGGGGYPTAKKWRQVRENSGAEKYLIMNGDEGDPGAFMDRMLMESYPFRLIEGMSIAALAVGARRGILYIRAEYPLAVRRMREALRVAENARLLGDDILGSQFSFSLEIRQGMGSFVCGEETALISSLEGRRGFPRPRPPYPAESGFRNRPTLVNNVETFAVIPWIIRHGGEKFAAVGTGSSSGTKVFALAGRVRNGGLIEVPMGISVREIIERFGGGMEEGHALKAVQIGGPSGGCLPANLCDTPVDYEALAGTGAIMGSGGLVVLDERDCLVDLARYFMAFICQQSCGRCVPCRIGTGQMLEILEKLCAGTAREKELQELEKLAGYVKDASLCGLGQTAPNTVLTTLRYFREEYEAHLRGNCPAGRCGQLARYFITDNCIGCTRCAQICPVEAIAFTPYERHVIDQEKCVRCGLCAYACQAITLEQICRD
jgi:NADH:ubiquinone oxidoreductase subunit F (NADH-binding)/NADH:ubiquinone oxidoreductase subunit E/Pyruvate/2-oxoacid:ferredoxin oxidoreductase delta subunit